MEGSSASRSLQLRRLCPIRDPPTSVHHLLALNNCILPTRHSTHPHKYMFLSLLIITNLSNTNYFFTFCRGLGHPRHSTSSTQHSTCVVRCLTRIPTIYTFQHLQSASARFYAPLTHGNTQESYTFQEFLCFAAKNNR